MTDFQQARMLSLVDEHFKIFHPVAMEVAFGTHWREHFATLFHEAYKMGFEDGH